MAQLIVDGSDLLITLSPREKFISFHGDLRVPLRVIHHIRTPKEPWSTMRGWRATGFAFHGFAAMGKRRHGTGHDFTLIWKEAPTIVLECSGFEFGQIIVSVDDAKATGARIAAAAGIAFDAAPGAPAT